MASELTFADVSLTMASPGPVGELPSLEVVEPVDIDPRYATSYLSAQGTAAAGRVLPYHPLARYGRDAEATTTRVAVLENEYLRATFLLGFGGRLWTLVDKTAERELLHQADPIRPANLALRNAWFAGGIEWNLGTRGHWPLTFDAVHASRVGPDSGAPVLRMWEFERMLRVTWRVDAWLPSGSRTLFVRPVVRNTTADALPVYWWSNVAVSLDDNSRVLLPADRALHFGYRARPVELPVPFLPDGTDISYPAASDDAADYFFDIGAALDRPWMAAIDRAGYGLAQASTARLRGRKLFVWGSNRGSEHWQQWLSGDRRYFEIQAGLAKTQYEQLLLPAGESFTWTEAYGPVQLEAALAHGTDWRRAVGEAERAVDQLIGPAEIHAAEQQARRWEDAPPAEPAAFLGSGWGALEVLAGHRAPDPATPYYEQALGDAQRPWLDLALRGKLPDLASPAAAISGAEWRARLEAGRTGWHDWLQLGLVELAAGSTSSAIAALNRSAALRPTPWAYRHLAILFDQLGDRQPAMDNAIRALQLDSTSIQLVTDCLQLLARYDRFSELLDAIDRLDQPVRNSPRVRFYECAAAVGAGELERAAALFRSGLTLPDIKEGEDSFSQLWCAYQEAAGRSEPLPREYDFGMHTERDVEVRAKGTVVS